MVSGVRCQENAEDSEQKTDDKGPTVSVFHHLTSVICYLTPDTGNLKPKIGPCFVN